MPATRRNYGLDISGLSAEDIEQTHPGFSIVCRKCGSARVIVENSMGYSETSGSWGSVDLFCLDCGEMTGIVEG